MIVSPLLAPVPCELWEPTVSGIDNDETFQKVADTVCQIEPMGQGSNRFGTESLGSDPHSLKRWVGVFEFGTVIAERWRVHAIGRVFRVEAAGEGLGLGLDHVAVVLIEVS